MCIWSCSSHSNLRATRTGLRCFAQRNRSHQCGAEFNLDPTSGHVPGWPAASPARRPAPRSAPRARGFEPALRARERRESGNESVPAGGCPAFVSSFPSGGEDMVRPGFRGTWTAVVECSRAWRKVRASVSAGSEGGACVGRRGRAQADKPRPPGGGAGAARLRGAAPPARGCAVASLRPPRPAPPAPARPGY